MPFIDKIYQKKHSTIKLNFATIIPVGCNNNNLSDAKFSQFWRRILSFLNLRAKKMINQLKIHIKLNLITFVMKLR